MTHALPGLESLIQTVSALRNPQTGCPWDRAQTHESLKPYALEEVHEFLESLDTEGPRSPETWEELGDVLFQVVLHAQLLQEQNLTDLDHIAAQTATKLQKRHPHVFDPQGPRYQSPQEVNRAWEQLKALERKTRPSTASRVQDLRKTPRSLPALQRAARIGEKVASWGFDWKNSTPVWDQVQDEMRELESAPSEANAQEEFGDVLFTLAQYARHRHWDPESLLRQANEKFLNRLEKVESHVLASQRAWEEHSLDELETYWKKAKAQTSS